MGRRDLTDDQWRRLRPLLPPQKPRSGRPERDHRTVINGILWVLRTGAPWRDLSERFGPWATVASRFHRWREQGFGSKDYGSGFWLRCRGKLMPLDRLSGRSITWTAPMRGRIARSRGKKGEGGQALGRSRGGFGTKIHLRVEGQGKPVAFVLTAGQRHEASVFEDLMAQGEVKRSGRGRPGIKPRRVCGGKGYSSRRIRTYLRRRGIRYTIPRKPMNGEAVLSTGPCSGNGIWWSGPSAD